MPLRSMERKMVTLITIPTLQQCCACASRLPPHNRDVMSLSRRSPVSVSAPVSYGHCHPQGIHGDSQHSMEGKISKESGWLLFVVTESINSLKICYL